MNFDDQKTAFANLVKKKIWDRQTLHIWHTKKNDSRNQKSLCQKRQKNQIKSEIQKENSAIWIFFWCFWQFWNNSFWCVKWISSVWYFCFFWNHWCFWCFWKACKSNSKKSVNSIFKHDKNNKNFKTDKTDNVVDKKKR